nr:BRO family protein [Rhizobium cremeum]
MFDFKGHQIRVVTIGGEPWFVAKDLYEILYGVTTGLSWVAGTLDGTERQVINRLRVADTLKSLFPAKGRGDLALISESGLYKLILRSDKPEAKPFQDWVTKEVLPAIRKDGGIGATFCPHLPTIGTIRSPHVAAAVATYGFPGPITGRVSTRFQIVPLPELSY